MESEICVMTKDWLEEVWKTSSTDYISATDPKFLRYKCPVFLNLIGRYRTYRYSTGTDAVFSVVNHDADSLLVVLYRSIGTVPCDQYGTKLILP